MTRSFIMLSALFLLLAGCGSGAAEKKETETKHKMKDEESKAIVKTGTVMPSEKCQFIFPSNIHSDFKDRNLKTYFAVQTETACAMTFTDPANKAELFISAEKMTSPEQAKRMTAVAQHMPGYIGMVDAGDGGHLSLTTEKATKYYDLYFSIKDYRCSISSKIKIGTEESAGIHFNENRLKKLAADWSRQLKDVLQ